MKVYFISFFLLILSTSIGAQNVGINKTDPEFSLDVRAETTAAAAQLNVANQDKSRYIRLFSGSNLFPDPSITYSPGKSLLFASFDDLTFAFNEYMRISPSGDVGIGISNPEARLDILGGDWNLDAGNPGDLRIGNATHNFRIGIATGGGGAGITRMYTNSNDLILGTMNSPVLKLESNGAITAPSISNTVVENAGSKALITKEYADATYKLDEVTTKEILIPATSFMPFSNFYRFGVFNGIGTSEDFTPIYASVILPVGSTITEISAYMFDNTANNYDFSLMIKNLNTNFDGPLFTLTTTGNSGNQVLSNTSDIQVSSNFAYYVRIVPNGASEWGGSDGIKGIKIVYIEN
jgi:hypothetical protein